MGQHGPDRYIEAQVWADEPLRPYLPTSSAGAHSRASPDQTAYDARSPGPFGE
jgi:hypothetical protein